MNERVQSAPAPRQRERPLGALARRMREILGAADLESENQRKAALRRALHEHAAGLVKQEIEALVDDLRRRFPDRIFESVSNAHDLASRSTELEQNAGRLREERDRLRKQVDHLGSLMDRLAEAAGKPVGRSRGGGEGTQEKGALPPETPESLMEVLAALFSFALNQEKTARSVADTLGLGTAAGKSESLTSILPRLAGGESLNQKEMEVVRRRLQSLQLLPGALMAGVQQSWKGGTREILEHLDPKTAEKDVAGVFKSSAVLKEVKQRFEQFWNQFDRNVEHYYRGRFERVYKDKMEDLP